MANQGACLNCGGRIVAENRFVTPVVDIDQQKNWNDIFSYSNEIWGYGNGSAQDAVDGHMRKFHATPIVVYRLLSKGNVIGYFCPVLKVPHNEQATPADQRPGVD